SFSVNKIFGMWLLWLACLLYLGTLIGGRQMIPLPIFGVGYFIGFILILSNKKIVSNYPSKFQKRITLLSIVLMIFLLFLLGGPHFSDENYRLVWLNAFLAVGIHFIPFAFIYGVLMIPLATLVIINALVGIFYSDISFVYFSNINSVLLAVFGIIFLLVKSSKQKRSDDNGNN
ncbi:hypothetical protein NGH44_12440, partial [Staphylococcus caprae]|uniref:DUF6609 family protein n=1 Tax=Staphylococcus caprae TaxID=29380 RepID=UPI002DB65B20